MSYDSLTQDWLTPMSYLMYSFKESRKLEALG